MLAGEHAFQGDYSADAGVKQANTWRPTRDIARGAQQVAAKEQLFARGGRQGEGQQHEHERQRPPVIEQRLQAQRPGLQALLDRWQVLPLVFVLLAFALTPALGEELFFRGYLLAGRTYRGRYPAWAAIDATAALFGLFHASVGGIIALERVLASALLGIVLGWVCWTSRSVWPGVVLHALSNSLMLLLARYGDELKARGWDIEQQKYLPVAILAAAVLGSLVGAFLVWLGRDRQGLAASVNAASAAPLPLGEG